MAKKKFNWWKAAIFTLLFTTVVFTTLYYHKQLTRYYYKIYRLCKRSLHKPHSDSFASIPFPAGYHIHGIDVSHYQEDVNWGSLRSLSTDGDTIHFTFAFIKATEGTWKEDRSFDDNWEDAHEQHITCGAYHYFLADKDPRKQAENYISSVKLKAGDLPPVIDVEDTRGMSKQQIVDGVHAMADLLELRYGAKPIIYSNISFIEDYLSDDFTDYYFWVAHYYQDELNIAEEVNWLFWQHSDKAMLFGCDQEVDVNVFNGNMVDFRSVLIQGGPSIRRGAD